MKKNHFIEIYVINNLQTMNHTAFHRFCLYDFISTVKTAGPKGKRRVPARRTYKLFRKADNFCQGIGQKNYGRLFHSLLLKPYTCPNEPGSKRSKDSCLVPLGVFCKNIHAHLYMPTKVNLKNNVIFRLVRRLPS